VAPLTAPVVPSNSESFQSCINSTASLSSQFPPDISADPSLINNPGSSLYTDPPDMPAYDYPSYAMPPADIKPGWDVLSGVSGSTSYDPRASVTSPQYPPAPRHTTPRGTKRMMNPRSSQSPSHVHPAVCLSLCMSVCLSVSVCMYVCMYVCM